MNHDAADAATAATAIRCGAARRCVDQRCTVEGCAIAAIAIAVNGRATKCNLARCQAVGARWCIGGGRGGCGAATGATGATVGKNTAGHGDARRLQKYRTASAAAAACVERATKTAAEAAATVGFDYAGDL